MKEHIEKSKTKKGMGMMMPNGMDRQKMMGMNMMSGNGGPERIYAFSDGVFAILITIMILEFKKPQAATVHALLLLWPTWISYAVSYLFVAIFWINHHFLMRYAQSAKLRLMWANFAHLFSASFIPFLTQWIAQTQFASVPVVAYASAFVFVDLTYFWLIWETLCDEMNTGVPEKARYLLHLRFFISLGVFIAAAFLAVWYPYLSFGLIALSLSLFIKPQVPHMYDNGTPEEQM